MGALLGEIRHCVDRDFLDCFRADFAASQTAVIILSPFVSASRCGNYYPVLQVLHARAVTVDIYVRPEPEQPESLRYHFSSVLRALEAAGAELHAKERILESGQML